jgi:hypothetical protein
LGVIVIGSWSAVVLDLNDLRDIHDDEASYKNAIFATSFLWHELRHFLASRGGVGRIA